ncbi:MAG: class I SAM-dependent methyltransferase [Candidatus Woesearchaeota archaeon]|jgi:SAM-dependent methyltransferase
MSEIFEKEGNSSYDVSSNDLWWNAENGFFGDNYVGGDNSLEGFIPGKTENLEDRTNREVLGILNVLGITKKQQRVDILDAPCGYGRHSIALAKKREDYPSIGSVCGVDKNSIHIQKAITEAHKLLGENWRSQVNFLEMDMRDINKLYMLSEQIKYDSIINMFFSFGFFFFEGENERLMQRFYDVLRDDGKLLIHTDVSSEMIESGNYRFNEVRNLVSGKKLIILENYNSQNKRLNGQWMTYDDAECKVLEARKYSVRIYSAKEYENMAKECGFSDVKIYGSFDKEEFTPSSHELIMVATKY